MLLINVYCIISVSCVLRCVYCLCEWHCVHLLYIRAAQLIEFLIAITIMDATITIVQSHDYKNK